METTHTLEAQVIGEIDRRAIEAKAVEVSSAEEVAPEPEHTNAPAAGVEGGDRADHVR